MKGKLLLFFIVLFMFAVPCSFGAEIDVTSTVTSVIDGDSFYIQGDEVRLADVSCPEWDEIGGSEATEMLTTLIDAKTVYLDTDQLSGRGPYGRLIAVVYVALNETHLLNVNEFMVQTGYGELTDYTNNEFNPYTWNLLVPFYSANSSDATSSTEIYSLNQQIEFLTASYLDLYSNYTLLYDNYETLQIEYNSLQVEHNALLSRYDELSNESNSSIPGFSVSSIGVAMVIMIIYVRGKQDFFTSFEV